jgi:hypothetical protein
VRVERDPAWWRAVADHPAVSPEIDYRGRLDFSFVEDPAVVPLALDHGGFLFHRTGHTYGLHALFTPGGWGKEVAHGLKLATEHMIGLGARGFTTAEVRGHRNSRPPLSHGWRCVGEFEPGLLGLVMRPWSLSLADWRASPAFRRMR